MMDIISLTDNIGFLDFFFKQIVLLHIKGLFILYGCMIFFVILKNLLTLSLFAEYAKFQLGWFKI